jgi:hypothetical protein
MSVVGGLIDIAMLQPLGIRTCKTSDMKWNYYDQNITKTFVPRTLSISRQDWDLSPTQPSWLLCGKRLSPLNHCMSLFCSIVYECQTHWRRMLWYGVVHQISLGFVLYFGWAWLIKHAFFLWHDLSFDCVAFSLPPLNIQIKRQPPTLGRGL